MGGDLGNAGDWQLTVNGALNMSSTPSTTLFVNASNNGEIDATSSASLAGTLAIRGPSTFCPALTPGHQYTLVSAASGVTGTFSNTSGAPFPMSCQGTPPTFSIAYNAGTVTATVLNGGSPNYPSQTVLSPNATGSVTNSPYTLTSADAGQRIRVLVGAANSAGVATAVPSGEVGPVTVSVAQLAKLLLGAVVPHGESGRLSKVLAAGGYSASITMPVAGSGQYQWLLKGKRSHGHATMIVVASGSHSFTAGHKTLVKLKLTGPGRRLLKLASSLALSAKVTVKPNGTKPGSTTRGFTLKG